MRQEMIQWAQEIQIDWHWNSASVRFEQDSEMWGCKDGYGLGWKVFISQNKRLEIFPAVIDRPFNCFKQRIDNSNYNSWDFCVEQFSPGPHASKSSIVLIKNSESWTLPLIYSESDFLWGKLGNQTLQLVSFTLKFQTHCSQGWDWGGGQGWM